MNLQTRNSVWRTLALLSMAATLMMYVACTPFRQASPQVAATYTANDKERDFTTNAQGAIAKIAPGREAVTQNKGFPEQRQREKANGNGTSSKERVRLNATQTSVAAIQPTSPFLYDFSQVEVIQESYPADASTNPYWWLNSGAYMMSDQGRGHTVQGELAATDPWRILYSQNNPQDTDNGYHPQNIFRMPTRSAWANARQILYFVITRNEFSTSPYRNESNGLLLFNRLQDNFNLYYTGIRVDGAAVIKKKIGGTYYTLAYTRGVYPGVYNRDTNPNLLPLNKWIGLRSEVVNLPDGSVSIKLYLDKGWTGIWTLVAEATDRGGAVGAPFTQPGYGGIRTDFMDVLFDNFRFINL